MVLLDFIPETTMSSSGRTSLLGFKLTSCFTVVLLICLETVLLSTVSNCAKTFYVHWNTSNSIFRIDNTDHIIDVNKGNLKFEYDQVNIICPVYTPGSSQEEDAEKYIIYNVSKEEYDTCRITNPNPRIIAICDKPHKLMYFTITFRPFTPQPGGLEFLAGYDYYFISTSTKEDLHRRIGGRCSTHNMKIVFKVCCSSDENNSGITGNGVIQTNSSVISKTPQQSITTMDLPSHSTSSINWPPSWTSTESSLLPSTQKTTETSVNVKIKPKKTNEYEKHPNDVVKNEELTYNNNSGAAVVPAVSVICFLGSVVLVIRKVR